MVSQLAREVSRSPAASLKLNRRMQYSTVLYCTVQYSTVPEQEGADHAEPLEPEPVAHCLLALAEG